MGIKIYIKHRATAAENQVNNQQLLKKSGKQMKLSLTIALLSALAAPLSAPIAAAEYDENIQAIVDQLREISDRARRERAADRWVVNSLEDLIVQYEWPWRNELLFEDFSDGDFSNAPQWEPVSGRLWVDASLGLRSRVEAHRPQPSAQEKQPPEPAQKDLGSAILGALLQEALRTESQQSPPSQKQQTPDGPAEIRLPLEIPGAFAFMAEFSAHNPPAEYGQLQFALHEERDAAWGYLITLHTGSQPLLELIQLRGNRQTLIEEIQIEDLNDGQSHVLAWRKNAYGDVELILDQQPLLRSRDREFPRGFKQLAIINQGGDFGVRSIQLHGATQ